MAPASRSVSSRESETPARCGARPARWSVAQLLELDADEPAEEARVAVVDRVAVVEFQRGADVGRRLFGAVAADPLARHAEVGEQGFASIEGEEHPFADPVDASERATAQLGEPPWRLPADDAAALGAGFYDAAAGEPGAEVAGGDLDFGEFGHGSGFSFWFSFWFS